MVEAGLYHAPPGGRRAGRGAGSSPAPPGVSPRGSLYFSVTAAESDPPELLRTVMFWGFVGQANRLR